MKQARSKPFDLAKATFDVVTVGAATRDMFLKSRHFERRSDTRAPDGFDTCLPMGAKIPVDELIFETGGGATNAAVTFANFKLKTACITRIGKDPGGREILDELKRKNISTLGVQSDSREHSAYSVILLSGSGSRTILVARGASKHLDDKTIPWNKLAGGWLYVTSLGGNEKLLAQTFKQAKLNRTRVAWNPGSSEIDMGMKKLLPQLLQSDVVILNREEAAGLAETSPRDLQGIFKILGPLPRLCLLVTDGKNGAYVHVRGMTWFAAPKKTKAINTTGAGDAFGSAFVASLIKDGEIKIALQAATLNAGGVVSHMGAKAGILKNYPAKKDLARIIVRQLE